MRWTGESLESGTQQAGGTELVQLNARTRDPAPDGNAGAGPNRAGSAGTLLVRVAAGDQAAFAEVFRVEGSGMRAVAFALLRDWHQAEEVVQEAMLQVWRSAARFDPARGCGVVWLLQITRARAIDRIRHNTAVARRDRHVAQHLHARDFDVVAETVSLRFEVALLHTGLLQLTAIQREALVMAFFSDLTYPQVAALLGVPLPTVKARIRDGLIRLRLIFDQHTRDTAAAA